MFCLKRNGGKRCIALLLALLLCLLSVPAFAVEPDLTVVLRKGSTGEQVKLLQQKLNDYHYYYGEISGSYDAATFDAVAAFQLKNFLGSDGIAGKDTLTLLHGEPSKVRTRELFSAASAANMSITLKKGASGDQVALLQKTLAEKGYYKYAVNGYYEVSTVDAVKAFQKDKGLTQDGITGKGTLQKLYEGSSVPLATATPVPSATPSLTALLKLGSTGIQVEFLQTRLQELGYYGGTISGTFDDATKVAVSSFQQRNSLTRDGCAGQKTLKKLYSSDAVSASGVSPTSTVAPSVTPNLTALLKKGSTGDQVKLLQKKLAELGYYTGAEDGIYGDGVMAAVKAFQQNNGLTADGLAGKNTLNKLYTGSPKPASASTPTVAPSVTPNLTTLLKKGSTGDQVKLLQKKLAELGYYTGAEDGSYGDAVVAAVKAFQKSNGLTADGMAGQKTLNKLYTGSPVPAATTPSSTPSPNPTSTAAPTVTPNLTNLLKKGSTGEQVKLLQKKLAELGYYTGAEDGSYSDAVVAAVKAFQKNNGLTADGMAGQKTLNKLYTGSPVPTTPPAPTPTPTIPEVPGEPTDATTTATPQTNIIMKKGHKGDQVILLHTALKNLGYFQGTVTNEYDSATVAAVKAFQKMNGLQMDGCAGPKTLALLYSGNAKEAPEGDDEEVGGSSSTEIFTYSSSEELNYTLKKGQSSVQVGRLQNALRALGYYGTVGSTVDRANYFGDYTLAAVKAYQKANNLDCDGLAGPKTLKSMYTAANGKTIPSLPPTTGIDYFKYDNGMAYTIENLDWFEGGSGVVPRGKDFILVDVRTGYTLKCHRMGGQNHIDFEPCTMEDTMILLAAQGGTWNYNRRPVWVVYEGRRIAASTYCYPHGSQTITNNGMEGQVCIHFLNSRTHGTNSVGEAHQKCVEEAYQAGLTNTLG